MREKKYLVAEEYIDTEFLFERYNMTTVEVDEWLEAHKYEGRPWCVNEVADRNTEYNGCPGKQTFDFHFLCSKCGMGQKLQYENDFCPNCGAEVIRL